ncbi:D1 dopamine receptor-like [Crotalus adamanteus]|uniref:D1 dopamine receptor-like n=1 Tax=Crotalus adamanteus TaxID=8729 RepID=A0AAW1BFF3_CROAD
MENASNHSQEVWEPQGPLRGWRVLAGCLLSLLVLSTLLGNSLVCLAVLRFPHLRTRATNWFVLSLALSDLCVGLLVMPWKAVVEVAGGLWLFGSLFCDTWVAFDIMCSTASILQLCIISLDRYWAIANPFCYERRMTPSLAFTMITLAWTLSILISFIPVHLHWHSAEATPGLLPYHCDLHLNRTYAIASSLISFYIPVSIMIGMYAQIFRIAKAQIRRISSLERAGGLCLIKGKEPVSSLRSSLCKETKLLQTLTIILGVFVCCWLPFFLLNCLLPFCDSGSKDRSPEQVTCISQPVFNIFMWLGWANSTINPVIYAFNVDFQQAFRSLLGGHHLPCCVPNHSVTQRVHLSGELTSYPHRKDEDSPLALPTRAVVAWNEPLPSTASIQGNEEQYGKLISEKEMLPSSPRAYRSSSNMPVLLPFQCETELTLETDIPRDET